MNPGFTLACIGANAASTYYEYVTAGSGEGVRIDRSALRR